MSFYKGGYGQTLPGNSRTGVDHVCDQKSLSQILDAYITEVIEYVREV